MPLPASTHDQVKDVVSLIANSLRKPSLGLLCNVFFDIVSTGGCGFACQQPNISSLPPAVTTSMTKNEVVTAERGSCKQWKMFQCFIPSLLPGQKKLTRKYRGSEGQGVFTRWICGRRPLIYCLQDPAFRVQVCPCIYSLTEFSCQVAEMGGRAVPPAILLFTYCKGRLKESS